MSSKVKSKKNPDFEEFIQVNCKGKEECIGCTYRVNRKKMKEFQKHLRVNKCKDIIICSECNIFRSLSQEMHDEHYENCLGPIRREDSPPPKREKKRKKK